MSSPIAILGTIAVGFAVNKIVSSITGSETLGMIGGLAVGGWAGMAISGAMAAGTAATAAGATQAGSALGVAGGATLGGVGAATPGVIGAAVPAAAAPAAGGGFLAGAHAAAPAVAAAAPAAAGSTGGGIGGWLGSFSPDELLKVAAGGISGMAEYRQEEKRQETREDYQKLLEERHEEDKQRYWSRGAFGVTNAGQVVPINAGAQLQSMNKRLGYQPYTSMGTLTNIQTVPRQEGGYLTQFGRFGGQNNA